MESNLFMTSDIFPFFFDTAHCKLQISKKDSEGGDQHHTQENEERSRAHNRIQKIEADRGRAQCQEIYRWHVGLMILKKNIYLPR